MKLLIFFTLIFSLECAFSSPKNFMFVMKKRKWIETKSFLKNKSFSGAQVMYSWRELEPRKNVYNFSKIKKDIKTLGKFKKRLFIQLQDVSFYKKFKPVPDYILNKEIYSGGVSIQKGYNPQNSGWMTLRWDKNVRSRFHKLIRELGKSFDGKIEGINLQESAFSIKDEEKLPSSYSHSKYRDSLIETMKVLSRSFKKSKTIQYANFMPGEWLPHKDLGYLRSLYNSGKSLGVCVGTPDLIPNRKSYSNHSYKFMKELGDHCKAVAVQNGNYAGKTATIKKETGKNRIKSLYLFATRDLKVDYIFWVKEEPYFTEHLLPFLSASI